MVLRVAVFGTPNVDTTVFGDEVMYINDLHMKFYPCSRYDIIDLFDQFGAALVLFDGTHPETRAQASNIVDDLRERYGNDHPVVVYDGTRLHAGNFDELTIPLIHLYCACGRG